MTEAIFKFRWYFGRMGRLDGLFISNKEQVKDLIGKELDFGEVLGKHSEVCGNIEADEIEFISDDPVFVESFKKAFGDHFGYNPLDAIVERDEDGERI